MTRPDPPLFGRDALLAVLDLLPAGLTALVGPEGSGRTAVALAAARRFAGRGAAVLYARPREEPLASALHRAAPTLGMPSPGPLVAPRAVEAFAGALAGRIGLIVLDGLPAEDLELARALCAAGAPVLVIAEAPLAAPAGEIRLPDLEEAAVAAWYAHAGVPGPGLGGRALDVALAIALGGSAPDGDGASCLDAWRRAAGGAAELLAALPAVGVDDAVLRDLGDAVGYEPWDGIGDAPALKPLLRDVGDGRLSLPPSLWRRLRARGVDPRAKEAVETAAVAAAVDGAGDLELLLHILLAPDGPRGLAARAALATAALPRLIAHGRPREALQAVARWRAAAQGIPLEHARALKEEAELVAALGQPRRAVDLFTAAVDEGGSALPVALRGAILQGRGRARLAGGDGGAIGDLEEAARAFEAAGTARGVASALAMRALGLVQLGRIPEAVAAFRAHLPLARAAGDRSAEAADLRNIGLGLLKLEAFADAVPALEEARAAAAGLGDVRGEGMALRGLAVARGSLGDLDGAVQAWRALLPLAEGLGDVGGQLLCWRELAALARRQGEVGAEVEALGRAVRLLEGPGHHHGDAALELALVDALARAGATDQARERLIHRIHDAARRGRADAAIAALNVTPGLLVGADLGPVRQLADLLGEEGLGPALRAALARAG